MSWWTVSCLYCPVVNTRPGFDSPLRHRIFFCLSEPTVNLRQKEGFYGFFDSETNQLSNRYILFWFSYGSSTLY